MGHKQSKRLKSLPEVTEIFELNDNHSDVTRSNSSPVTSDTINDAISYPKELKNVIENVETIEGRIGKMTGSEIDLYYATFKDDLHNNWQKVYSVMDTTANVRDKKIEVIERIKGILRGLNDHVLHNKKSDPA